MSQAISPQFTGQPAKVILDKDGNEHKFYEIEQADQILHTRYMMAEVQEMYIRSGLSEEFLKSMAQLIIDRAMKAKDVKQLQEDMIAIGQNLKGRIGFIAEAKMYERMACVYFMLEGEPTDYQESWQQKKVAIWRAADEQDFFIIAAFNRTTNLANTSDTDILSALIAASERISQLPTTQTLS